MKIIITEQQLRYLLRNKLNEGINDGVIKIYDGVYGNSLSQDEKVKLYDSFQKTYNKSIGSSWDIDKFIQRLNGWVLYGDSTGFVLVRRQNGGLVKLTGSAGSTKGIYQGIKLLIGENAPVWGLVTPEIASMMKKIGFIVPGKFILNTLFKFIPPNALGGAIVSVNQDGTLTVNSDMGTINKMFVANKNYFKALLGLGAIAEKMPNVIKLWINKL